MYFSGLSCILKSVKQFHFHIRPTLSISRTILVYNCNLSIVLFKICSFACKMGRYLQGHVRVIQQCLSYCLTCHFSYLTLTCKRSITRDAWTLSNEVLVAASHKIYNDTMNNWAIAINKDAMKSADTIKISKGIFDLNCKENAQRKPDVIWWDCM